MTSKFSTPDGAYWSSGLEQAWQQAQHEKERSESASRLAQAYQAEKEREELPYHHRNLNLPKRDLYSGVPEYGTDEWIRMVRYWRNERDTWDLSEGLPYKALANLYLLENQIPRRYEITKDPAED